MGCQQWRLGCRTCDVRLFDSVKEFFKYPSLTSTTVYNLFVKSLPNERGHGCGRQRRRDLNEGGTESGGEEECDAIEE